MAAAEAHETATGDGAPLGPLLALAAAVLLAHLALLGGVQFSFTPAPLAATRAFTVRAVVPPPLSPPMATPPVKPPAPPRPRPPRPRPAPPVAAPPPPPVQEEAAPAPVPLTAMPPDSGASLQAVDTAEPAAIPAPIPAAEPVPAAEPPPPPVRVPASARLAFDVRGAAKGFSYSARAELSWQQDGARYTARQEIGAFLLGSRVQTSRGDITAQGLVPERFSDKTRSEKAAHFDYDQHRVTFSANAPDAALPAGAQDRLSVFLQLAALLGGDPQRYPPGTTITLQAVGTSAVDEWAFTVGAEETLDLPAGPLAAWRLSRVPRHPYDQQADIWLAPGLDYLPVRIRLTQSSGDFADLQLRAAEK
ncbi:DUF3108 domain-containing protein [Ramlibacter sp. H39-3-26]|uniref:DUF3108 domain-containing protein n=1 Tax=Curvibacter soli TaxID=3031331 RepID=UPI0023DB1D84|nr:DUF3108 domain-containing protein [Ramlibacter sp. H39-3-26]MDF1486264.1 DUF3108 domain-containing protein [Ramlibacter sp. H39-3-26]